VDAIVETNRALSIDRAVVEKTALGRWQMQTVARSIESFTGHDFLVLADKLA
jgi:sensor histidine kinase regulating citrate/malate metabolism